jgi:DNA-directed RNA polymerase specialized sigma subunit
MTTKEYLSQAYLLNKKIEAKMRRLELLREMSQRASAFIDMMPRNQRFERSPMEEAIVKFLDLETEIESDVQTLLATVKEIQYLINSINDIECETILEMRYLSYMKWEDIWSRLDLSKDQVLRLHRKALSLVKIPVKQT